MNSKYASGCILNIAFLHLKTKANKYACLAYLGYSLVNLKNHNEQIVKQTTSYT